MSWPVEDAKIDHQHSQREEIEKYPEIEQSEFLGTRRS